MAWKTVAGLDLVGKGSKACKVALPPLAGVALDREAEDAAQIDALQPRGRDPPDEFWRDDLAPVGPAIQHRLHLRRVPGHHNVGQKAQRVGHRLHLVDALGLRRTDPPGVDGALQGVDRFAAIEHPPRFAPERFIDEVVRQECRAQQPAKERCGSSSISRFVLEGLASASARSSMPDLEILVAYDEAARTVTLTADAFDSTLVSEFAIEHLPQAGIIVFADETGGPRIPGARWQLMFSLAGVLYKCEVALQAIRGAGGTRRATTRLSPR